MKTLMLSTALVASSAFAGFAQDATTPMSQGAEAQSTVPAFLASDFTGMSLYTLDSEDARAVRDSVRADGVSEMDRDRMRWTSSETFVADRNNWQDVGSINDIVMTQDGEFRGILIDVGGFLGLGARTVMVDFEDLYFVSDDGQTEDLQDFFVVISMSEEELESLPEWNEDQLTAGFETRDYRMGDRTTGMTDTTGTMGTGTSGTGTMGSDADVATTSEEPAIDFGGDTTAVFTENHQMLDPADRTADRLIGAQVYDLNGENIGSVTDIVLADGTAVEGIVVDVGGFLGMGEHTVSLPISDAQIGWNANDNDVRVRVTMTADQLEAMPEYEG